MPVARSRPTTPRAFFHRPNTAIIGPLCFVALGSRMDVLSEVLDTLQLRSIQAESIRLDAVEPCTVAARQARVHVVLSGACRLRVDAGDAPLLLRPLDGVVLVGEQRYALEPGPGDGSRGRLLRCTYAFERGLPHPFTRHFPALLCLRSGYLTDDSELGRAVSLLDGELINARLAVDFVALRLAEIILVELLRRCQLEGAQPAFLAALSDPPVHRALQHIHAEPERGWQVVELARAAGLSRGVFANRFHLRVGEPPLRYLRLWRLLRARRELQNTTRSIKEIATRSGYGSSAGFRRAVRRMFGCPPSELRSPAAQRRARSAASG